MLRTRTTGTDLRFGVDHLLQVVPGYLALIGGGAVASLAAVGQLRGAVIVYSPLASAMYAIRLTLLRPDHDGGGRRGVPRSVAVYAWTSVAYSAIVVGAFSLARSTLDGRCGRALDELARPRRAGRESAGSPRRVSSTRPAEPVGSGSLRGCVWSRASHSSSCRFRWQRFGTRPVSALRAPWRTSSPSASSCSARCAPAHA